MNNSVTLFANGQRYDLPDSEVANFRKTAEASNIPVEDGQSFRTKDGDTYTIPSSQIEAFRAAAPDAESVRPFRFADNSTKYMTMPEMSKFLRSKEWREGEQFKADREERDRAVAAKMGGDGEMHSPTWAAIKGGLKGAAQGFWQGGNAAANKIAKAIPEIGISLESALGNAINLGGNAPNAVGNWFLADAKSGKVWLDAHLPDSAKDWTGYEDWSTKTADKFAEVSAMGYKFAPAMATGGSTALVNTMFASDGLNAASQTFDNAINSGYTPAEANAAAAASFLVNYYGAKLVTKAGGVADSFKNPILHQLGAASGVGTTMGVQSVANRGIENVTGGRIDETTGFPDKKIRPLTEGMGEAFAEGATEGILFHAINAIPGAVVGGANMAAQRMRETRELKEYRKDSLLAVARGEDGGELLDTLLPTRGLDAAIRARKGGADVSRKMAQGADLPDNMSVAERNEVIDAIIKARGERAAQNAVKVDGFRAEALDAAIKEVGGEGEVAQDIRARVISKLKNARELDDPFRREELVGEAFEEWNKEHKQEKPNETGNVPDEKPAQPKPPVETRAEGAEAVRPVEAEPPRGEAPGVVEKPTVGETKPVPKEELSTYVKNPHGEPQEFSVAVGEPKPGEWTSADSLAGSKAHEGRRYRLNLKKVWNPKEGFEGEDFSPEMLDHAANSLCDIMEKAGMKVNRESVVDNFRSADESFDIGVLIRSVGRENFEAALRKLGYDGFMSLANEYHVTAFDGKAVVPVEGRAESAAKPVEATTKPKVGEDTSKAAKPKPDGKGKMVKPKAAESDYGVTMFEEPSVDGEGVSYVVKDGPSDAHRMMFKSKAEAEARLAALRAERKAIKESPSATLADGTKVRLLKTNEGWVPYNENYIDLRRGVFNAAKTKAGAIKVAEKGVKQAKDVAEFNSAYKRFEEDFGLDEFNKKVGWGNENGEGWNESAALEHLRQFDLETLADLKERAKRFNLGHHNGRNEKIQEWFDKVISEKSPIPDGKGKMVKPEKPASKPSGEQWTKEQYEERKNLIATGKPVSVAGFPKGEALAVKRGRNWVVIDGKSGLRFGIGRTRKDAIADAETNLKNHTKEQVRQAREMGSSYFNTARDAYEPKASDLAADAELRKGFDKTVKSALSQEGRPIDNLHDAAERLTDTIKDKYDGDANVEKALDKALADFKENHPLGRGIKPSESAEYFKEFADELAKKYEIPGYDGKVEAPKYGGREMKVGNVDSIQKKLFELRGEYADTSVIEEGAFDELPFREIDAEKLSARDLKELKMLEKAASDALFDIDTDGIEFEKSGVLADESRKLVDAYTEARDNLNRFLEQADRYQHLKRDKRGQPLFSPSKPASDSKTIGDTIADLDRIIAEEESGAAPSGKAEGLPSRAENFAPGPGTKGLFSRLVSKNSIVRAIKDNFPEFAIRGKNTTNIGKNYNGHFEPWRELIRSKDMSSIDTIPHEIGHGISMIAKRKMMNIPQEVKRELAKWGRDLYGNKRPAAGYMEEGFAEYVRGYMTGAEDLATQAPHLDAWFRNSFAKKNPDFVRRMDRVRAEVMRWRMQNDVQKVAAMQNPETSAARRAWDKVKSVFTQEAWNDEGATLTKGYKKSGLDSLHEWREDFRQLEKLVKSGQGGSQAAKDLAAEINRKILSDPRIFASNARGTSKARVLDMAKYGVTNLTGTEKIGDVTGFDANGKPIRNNNTESYRDIFGDFTKKELADFDVYAAAKVGLENYVKKGREFGMDQATLERVVSKLESPRFLNALERFTAFSRRALSVGLEAGALTPEQYQKIVGEHKYYVRTERRLAEDGAGTGGRQQNPIKAIKGSTRNIVPPRTATLMQIEKQLRYFQTMKTLNMIARDVLQAEKANEAFFKNGTGRDYKIGANLPVKVPNAKESVKFKSEKLRKQVVDALNSAGAQGAGGETGDALFDQLFADGDAPLTVFRERPSDGRHGLVSTYIDGKLVTFELPDAAWEKYITGMEKGNGGFDNKAGDFFWNVVTAPTKALRLGATTLNPAFATANFVRDTFHAAIMSESNAKPLVSSVSGMMNDILGRDAGKLFRSMGGEMAMLMGSGAEAQAKHMSEVALAKNLLEEVKANTTLLSPFSGITRVIADILAKPEMGPRVREVMGVMRRAQAAGLDREASAWLAFAAGKDISIDFGKHGYLMKRLNQLIPYSNAWYRGLEQFARKLGVTDALPTQFEERKSLSLAKTATRALVTLSSTAVANSIATLLLMDEDERRAQFNKTPREKWEYDELLGVVRFPLPFELGSVFYAIPKAMVYEAFGDKGAVKEAMWHAISSNLGKYSDIQAWFPPAISGFVDNLRNKKYDDSPVVAPHIMDAYPKDKWMWYDHSTTEVAKWVGKQLNWAPAHIDHIANTWTGGMWKRFLSPASDTTLSTATGFSTFRPRPTARRDVRDFYEFRSEAQSHYNAGNASLEDIGRLRRANKLHEEIAPLFKEARELGSSGLSQSERNKRREAIMDEVFDKIHEWRVAETDDRKGGIAKAADALTSSVEISDDVRSRNLAALKGISYEEAAAALKAYGREKMQTPVRNSRGFKTGRMKTHPRWTNETIQKRLRILRRVMDENGD